MSAKAFYPKTHVDTGCRRYVVEYGRPLYLKLLPYNGQAVQQPVAHAHGVWGVRGARYVCEEPARRAGEAGAGLHDEHEARHACRLPH